MRLLRAQIPLRLVMIGVAALSLLLAAMVRPYPVWVADFGDSRWVYWTDGTRTLAREAYPMPAKWKEYGPLVRVTWSDGSWSLHFKQPVRPFKIRDPKR